MSAARRPIGRRLVVMAIVAIVGAVTFLPFLAATGAPSMGALATFAIVVSVVATFAAWLGLRFADATGLPMPLLRAFETGERNELRAPMSRALAATTMTGIALGLVGVGVLKLVHAPSLPGSATARALSTFFAAGPLEIVLHLFVMSGVVQLARGRRWVGIVAAAAALVLFHLSDAPSQPASIIAASIVGNGAAGLAFGVLYASFGFEFAMLGHAVAHLITLLAG